MNLDYSQRFFNIGIIVISTLLGGPIGFVISGGIMYLYFLGEQKEIRFHKEQSRIWERKNKERKEKEEKAERDKKEKEEERVKKLNEDYIFRYGVDFNTYHDNKDRKIAEQTRIKEKQKREDNKIIDEWYRKNQINCSYIEGHYGPKVFYKEYIQSFFWLEKKKERINKYGMCCEACNKNVYYENQLNFHHHRYVDENGYDIVGYEREEDMALVCTNCHNYIHFYLNGEKVILIGEVLYERFILIRNGDLLGLK